MRIVDALSEFVLQLQANGRSVHTVRQYQRHVRAFDRWSAAHGHAREIEDVTHRQVAEFLTSPEALTGGLEGRKRETSMNALRTSLRCFFGFLRDAGYTAHDPAALVQRARCASPPPRGLSDTDRARLLSTLEACQHEGPESARDWALVVLALATGLRLGSLVGLDVADLDLEAGELLVRTAKGRRPTVVRLEPDAAEHLAGFVEALQPAQGPLFRARGGGRISARQVQRRFAGWGTRAGLRRPLHPHALRHARGAEVYAATRDLLAVQAALGHASIVSAAVYVARSERVLGAGRRLG